MGQQLAVLAVDLLVGEDHLVDAVIVPLVVGRHLIDPLGLAGVDVARPDGHRPLVVAGPLLRVPGRGIARAVVDQVELRIVGVPAPGRRRRRSSTDRLARCLCWKSLPTGLPSAVVFSGSISMSESGPIGIAAPGQLAGLQIVGADPTANAELAAGDADEHLVLEDERRVGAGLALGRIAVLHRPDDLAGLRVERDQRRVGLMQEDLAVGVGEAAVDRVAAHHRNDVRILLGLVFPEDLAVVVEVEREDGVGERRMNIHHVADDQRRAFVTAQHAGRERPGRRELVDVIGVDLLEFRVARVGEVPAWASPTDSGRRTFSPIRRWRLRTRP